MITEYRHSGRSVDTFRQLMNQYLPEEFDSPARSTVPNLAFWTDTETRITDLCMKMGYAEPESCILEFEYQVLPVRGKGKASHTDVMITWENTCIAVEAKFKEPPYPTVNEWLALGKDRKNRKSVLSGWYDMISNVIGKSILTSEVGDIPYQMIHRVASTCSRSEPRKNMFYQVFSPTQETLNYYRTHLSGLRDAIGDTPSVRLFLWEIEIVPSRRYSQMLLEWQNNLFLSCRVEVIRGLNQGDLMTFGKQGFEEIK